MHDAGKHDFIGVEASEFARQDVPQRRHVHAAFPQAIGEITASAMALRLAQLIHDQHHGQRLDRIHPDTQNRLPDVTNNLVGWIERHRIGQPNDLGRQQRLGDNDFCQGSHPQIGVLNGLQHSPTRIQTGRETELADCCLSDRNAEGVGGFKYRLTHTVLLQFSKTQGAF